MNGHKATSKRKQAGQTSREQIEALRPWIFQRDNHQCLATGSTWAKTHPCWGPLTIQHAVGRGMGGSALFDEPAMLRTFCLRHNDQAEALAEFGRICRQMGWSLPRNRVGVDAEAVPVRYPDGRDYLLSNIGYGRSLLTRDEAAELRALNGMEVPS